MIQDPDCPRAREDRRAHLLARMPEPIEESRQAAARPTCLIGPVLLARRRQWRAHEGRAYRPLESSSQEGHSMAASKTGTRPRDVDIIRSRASGG